jgi:DTW domain-containing protein YfiP
VKPRGFRQARCAGCGLTPAACVCHAHARLPNAVAISVVMTRSEARSASNTGRLLALWLPGVELHVHGGEHSARQPDALLARPGSALLFPGGSHPQPLPPDVRHLIVPDGTWAQARRIERRWFAPSGPPRISLAASWPSVYGLRRGSAGLCTFEAVAVALGLLGDAPLAQALLERFVEWVRRAQILKAGGSPSGSATDSSAQSLSAGLAQPQSHPAATLLRALAQPEAPSRDSAGSATAAVGSAAPQRRARM